MKKQTGTGTKQEYPVLRLDGREALPGEYKRVMNVPAPSADKQDLATKSLHSVVRGFSLLRT